MKLVTLCTAEIQVVIIFISKQAFLPTFVSCFQEEIWQNGEYTDEPSLKKLWSWLYCVQSLVQNGYIDTHNTTKFPGVRYWICFIKFKFKRIFKVKSIAVKHKD